ncbi:hypothetical protein EV182_008285, partial [Spiromyces aspiralis]
MIAQDKRTYLDSEYPFWSNILTGFNPNMEHWTMLVSLALELRATLIDWEGEPDCKGSLKVFKQSGPLASLSLHSVSDKDLVDPFEQRAKHYKRISADLLGVLEKYAKEAEVHITPQQEERQQPQQQQQQEQQQQQQQQSWQGRLRRQRGRGAR